MGGGEGEQEVICSRNINSDGHRVINESQRSALLTRHPAHSRASGRAGPLSLA